MRLVATQVINFAREDAQANTPPLKAARVITSRASSGCKTKVLALYDATVAFLHVALGNDEMLCVRGPRDIRQKGELMLLAKALYGARKAGQMWQEHIYATMIDAGFVANAFLHAGDNVLINCHGDDFLASGEPQSHQVDR